MHLHEDLFGGRFLSAAVAFPLAFFMVILVMLKRMQEKLTLVIATSVPPLLQVPNLLLLNPLIDFLFKLHEIRISVELFSPTECSSIWRDAFLAHFRNFLQSFEISRLTKLVLVEITSSLIEIIFLSWLLFISIHFFALFYLLLQFLVLYFIKIRSCYTSSM